MENKLEKKYGLFTAICMVVGIVVGSGVFFKAQVILQKTGGDMPLGILAWLIGGAIMIVCILAFSAMAQKYEKVNGIVDYAEAIVGKRYGYYIGWFLSTTYYPTLTSALAWLSARYTLVFVTSVDPDFPLIVPAEAGGCIIGPECLALMLFYMVCAYAVNALSPKLAGKFQVATTVIKFIPLALMAVVGIIFGLANGMLTNNFTTPAVGYEVTGSPLFAAVCATAFAYEGWIIATSINAELKDSKRNLPKALLIGGLIIVATYILYYIGVAGGATNQELCVHQRVRSRSRQHPQPLHRHLLHGHDERPDARLLPRPLLPCRPRRGPPPRAFQSGGQGLQPPQQLRHPRPVLLRRLGPLLLSLQPRRHLEPCRRLCRHAV